MSMEWMDYEGYEEQEKASEQAEDALEAVSSSLGSGEMTEQELLEEQRRQEQLEKLYNERADLQRELRNAQENLRDAQKDLEKVEDSGMESWISNREYQVKVYTKEVADLERELYRLDGEISLLE